MLDFAVGFELPSVNVSEVGAGQKITEVYEEFDVQNNFIVLCEIGHFADHSARLSHKLAEIDS